MTKRAAATLEAQLAEVARLQSAPAGPELNAALTAALAHRSSHVNARAARIVKDRGIDGLERALVACFERHLAQPVKTDPGCHAKLAALEALDAGGTQDPDCFLRASRHVQKEASWGPPVDTATGVRARAVLALAHMGYPDLLLVAGELLADAEPPVRQAAAEALAACGDRAAAALLILMARRRDEDPVVYTAYLAGLLQLAPDRGLALARELLTGPDEERRELAAIALGQSGADDAVAALLAHYEAMPLAAERATALRALGLHRSERALEALLTVIAEGTAKDADVAVRALAPRRFDARVRERAEAAARKNTEADLADALAEAFGEG